MHSFFSFTHSFHSRRLVHASHTSTPRSQTPSPPVPTPVPTPRNPHTSQIPTIHPSIRVNTSTHGSVENPRSSSTYSRATQTYRSAHPRALPPPRVAIAPNRPPRSVASVARRSSFDDDDDDEGRRRRRGVVVKTTPVRVKKPPTSENRKLNLEFARGPFVGGLRVLRRRSSVVDRSSHDTSPFVRSFVRSFVDARGILASVVPFNRAHSQFGTERNERTQPGGGHTRVLEKQTKTCLSYSGFYKVISI